MMKFLRINWMATFLAGSLAGGMAVAAEFIVDTLDDSGAGSLRQAIIHANANAGADSVVFAVDLGGGHSAPFTVAAHHG